MELSSRQADFDALARQQIPGYSSLARLSVSLLAGYPSLQPSGSQVLVVGCGTGAELREAQGLRPDWALTGVDPAASLLDEARRRLGTAAKQVRWVDSRVEDLPGEASYGAAIAVLVLQELPDDGAKLAFLSALARLLLLRRAPTAGGGLRARRRRRGALSSACFCSDPPRVKK